MLALAFLMISNVSYPAVPTVGYRKVSEILGSLVVAGTIFGVLFLKKQFYFPLFSATSHMASARRCCLDSLAAARGDIPVISDDDEEIGGIPEPREIRHPDIEGGQRTRRRRKRKRGYNQDDPNRSREQREQSEQKEQSDQQPRSEENEDNDI
jgi:hypothetical protein